MQIWFFCSHDSLFFVQVTGLFVAYTFISVKGDMGKKFGQSEKSVVFRAIFVYTGSVNESWTQGWFDLRRALFR